MARVPRSRLAGWPALVAGALCALLVAAPAAAQRSGALVVAYTSPTLKRIDETRVVRLGYRASSPPFAFVDAAKKPVGYSLDLCEIVVEEIVAELRKDIRAAYRAVTPEDRFELVSSGKVDLECGSSNNTAERRNTVAFSPTIFVGGTRLMVRRGSHILSLRDLNGRTVVLTRGTVHEAAIPKLAERQKLAINFVFAADHQLSYQMLAAGKADAFANDDVQLYGMLAEMKSAAVFRVI